MGTLELDLNQWLRENPLVFMPNVVDYVAKENSFEKRVHGDLIVKDLENILSQLYAAGEEFYIQKLCHRHMLRQCIPSIYGKRDFEVHRRRLAKKYRLEDESVMGLLMKMPRRMGKTQGTAMFITALALACPNQTIAIFAPVIKTAQEFVHLCHQTLQQLPFGNSAIQRPTSKEEIHIRCRNGNRAVNRIRAYSSVASVRL